MAQARTASLDTNLIRQQVAPFADVEGKPPFTSPVTYPTNGDEFPVRLAVLADMLADESLPIKCVSLNAVGGYDTHSDEVTTLATNLGQTVESVVAFQRDLEARGLDDRVVIQLWSEFGRRPQENGSGTDHGAAGVSFLIGSRVRGKMVGEFPGLTKLDENENLDQHLRLPGGVLGPAGAVDGGRSRPRDPRCRHRPARAGHLRHGPTADRMTAPQRSAAASMAGCGCVRCWPPWRSRGWNPGRPWTAPGRPARTARAASPRRARGRTRAAGTHHAAGT